MTETIVLVTGGFDPLHSGHIAYFKSAKELGHILIVGLNSDAWLERKKGRAFMPFNERLAIVRHLNMVDWVIDFDDSDGSAVNAIRKVREQYPNSNIIFANGGDRTKENIPEMLDFPIVFPVIKSNAKAKIPRRINSTLNKVEISENLPKQDKKEASENAPQ